MQHPIDLFSQARGWKYNRHCSSDTSYEPASVRLSLVLPGVFAWDGCEVVSCRPLVLSFLEELLFKLANGTLLFQHKSTGALQMGTNAKLQRIQIEKARNGQSTSNLKVLPCPSSMLGFLMAKVCVQTVAGCEYKYKLRTIMEGN